MKATGIVRRIDDLGRVVVPKEIRRTLRIREGDPMEIFTGREGEVVLKKYSPLGEMWQFAQRFVQVLSRETKTLAIITDRDQVIAASGSGKKEYEQKRISQELEEAMKERARFLSKAGQCPAIPVVGGETQEAPEQIVCTILSEGDAIGAVVLLAKEQGFLTPADQKLAITVADFLGGQYES